MEEYAANVGKSVAEVQDEFHMLMEAQTLAMDNANNAYKTAGLSANEYMETVTSFAASLKSSTENEVEAAKAADQAVIDMSDNANKMGTSMESIQNAYQGFSKQNYTMLDNLKLGYGGTKEEMQRLLEDAQKLSGQKYDISNLSDVYSAIHVIQDELGITGTTAEEASTTIQGSVNAVKASWKNLVTGMADGDADFDTLISNFVESVSTAADNLIPRIEVAIGGIENLIDEMMPVVMDKIPEIINSVLPKLLQAGVNLVNTLVEGIGQNSGELIQGASQIISQLTDAFITLLPELITLGIQVITQIMLGMAEGAPGLIPTITDTVVTIVGALSENLPMLIDAGVQLIEALAQGIVDNLPQLMETASEIATTILDGIGDLCPALTPVTDAIQLLIDNFDTVTAVLVPLTAAFAAWKAVLAVSSLIDGVKNALNGMTIAQYAAKTAQDLLNTSMLANPITWIVMAIAALVAAIIYLWNTNEGFRNFWIGVWNAISSFFINVWNNIVQFCTQTIPEMISNIGTWFSELPGKIAYWLAYALTKVVLWAIDMPAKAKQACSNFLKNAKEFFQKLPGTIWDHLLKAIQKIQDWKKDIGEKAKEAGKEFFDNIVDALKDLPDKLTEIAKNAVDGAINGIKNKATEVTNAVKNLFKNAADGANDAVESHAQAASKSNSKGSSGKGVAGYSQQPVSSYSTMSKGRSINAGTARMTYEGASASGNYGYSMNMDYRKMKQIFTESMQEMNLVVQLDNRQMGRVIRGYS